MCRLTVGILIALCVISGCASAQDRFRSALRKAERFEQEGNYAAAVASYTAAMDILGEDKSPLRPGNDGSVTRRSRPEDEDILAILEKRAENKKRMGDAAGASSDLEQAETIRTALRREAATKTEIKDALVEIFGEHGPGILHISCFVDEVYDALYVEGKSFTIRLSEGGSCVFYKAKDGTVGTRIIR